MTFVAVRGTLHVRIKTIASLDGIRALAVVLVFLSHALPFFPGMLGVTVFFFLSGYLITTILRVEMERTGRLDLVSFYLKRALRIFPPLYAAILFGLLLCAAGLIAYAGETGLASNALFFTNYLMIWSDNDHLLIPGLDVLWSLAVEEHFYMIFPLLYIAIAPMPARRQFAILTSLCVAFLLWRIVLNAGMDATILRTRLSSDTRMDSILFGCIMALFANPVMGDPLSDRIRAHLRWAVPVSLAVLLFGAVWHDTMFRETIRYSLDGIALFACFTWAITAEGSWVHRLLNSGPMRFMGRISYEFYLIHHLIIFAVRGFGPPIAVDVTLSFLLSIVAATGLYYLLDRPLARYRAMLNERRLQMQRA